MKKNYLFLLLIFASVSLKGQPSSDYGILAGTSSYLGDINPSRLFYSPSLAGGIFYRYNLHPRQAIRTSLIYGGLKANDLDFSNNFQIARKANFSASVVEWNLQFEFNFFPYSTRGKRWDYTPYIAAGAGIAFVKSTSFTYLPEIPFSLGFKINIFKNMGLEAEYGFRKTFYDNFDGSNELVAPSDVGWIHNNDWYTFTGIAISWKIKGESADCPAYNDVKSKGKR